MNVVIQGGGRWVGREWWPSMATEPFIFLTQELREKLWEEKVIFIEIHERQKEKRDSPGGSDRTASAYNAGDRVWSLGLEDLLAKVTAAHSSILACKIPWTEESVGLQSVGPQWVGRDWATSLSLSFMRDKKRKEKV